MPLRAASSLTPRLRAPPLADGVNAGIRGWSCVHSSWLTGCRLNEDADWWSLPQEELLEVNRANAAFMNVSADGRYELEVVAHEELGDADVELVVRNTSGRFFFGAGEMMSSAGLEPEAEYGNVFLDAVPGSYLVRARQRGGTVTVSLTPTTLDASNSFGDLVRLGT